MTDQIDKLNEYVNEYYKCGLDNPVRLNELLQKITGILFYLETLRSEVHDEFQDVIFKLTEKGKSVARAQNEAHVLHPEMYKLRRIMDAGYRISDAIRTNISFIKHEMNLTQ